MRRNVAICDVRLAAARIGSAALVCALALCTQRSSAQTTVAQDRILRETQLTLARRSGDAARDTAIVRAAELNIWRIKVKEGDNLRTLLAEHAIEPNSASMALVYQLNPDLPHADRLQVGQELLIPGVVPSGDRTQAKSAARFALLVASEEQTAFTTLSGTIVENSNELAVLGSTSAHMRAQATLLEAATVNLSTVHGLAAAIVPDALKQINGEAAALASLTEQLTVRKEPLNAAQVDQVRAITQDIALKSELLKAGANQIANIEVRTLDHSNGSERKLLRVRYSHPATPDEVETLPETSSPAKGAVPIADYLMWAEDATGARVSDKTPFKVRARPNGGPFVAELLVRAP